MQALPMEFPKCLKEWRGQMLLAPDKQTQEIAGAVDNYPAGGPCLP
jgi:hypothetical protein